jgi:hypothetical protein
VHQSRYIQKEIEMPLPDFSTLAPYGIGIVAIVGLLVLGFRKNPYITGAIIAAILLIVIIDELLKPMIPRPADKAPKAPPAPPASVASWVDTNVLGDWGGRDRFTPPPPTNGSSVPMYQTKEGLSLCDESHVGYVAVCWEQDCTYKNAAINFGITPMDGKRRGRVYICGRVVNR